MNEKNLPDDIASKSLNELTDLADEIIKNLENRNNLENTSNPVITSNDHQVAYLNMLLIEWQEEYFLQLEYRQY